jgi:general secretion pathway protein H
MIEKRRSACLSPRYSRVCRGFTLLEIMLVIVLMALASAGVLMALPNADDSQELEKYARRFAAVTQFVQEQAIITANEYGIQADEKGYRFITLSDNRWQLAKGRLIAEQLFEAPFSLHVELDALEEKEEDTLGFTGLSFKQSDGLFEENFIEEDKKSNDLGVPQIFLMASGEATPFTVAFVSDDSDIAWWVYGDELGQLVVERGSRP